MPNKKIYKDKEYIQRILEEAARDGKTEIVETLIENGAEINNKKYSPLIAAFQNKQMEVVKLILDKGADVNLVANGTSALREAAQLGDFELVKFLVEKGAAINFKDRYRNSPLSYAIFGSGFGKVPEYSEERKSIIKFLIENKADTTDIDLLRYSYSEEQFSTEQIKFLLDSGIPVDSKKSNSDFLEDFHSSLEKACLSEKVNLGIIKLLIERGANPNPKTDSKFGSSLLNTVIYKIHEHKRKGEKLQIRYTKICLLLIQAGADILAKYKYGRNPITSAIASDNLGILMYMFRGRKSDILKDPRSKNLIHTALSYGNKVILQFLIKKGLDVNSLDENGLTPLHTALRKFYHDHINVKYMAHSELEDRLEPIRILLKNGADVKRRKKNHSSPLHYAVNTDIPHIFQLILDHGADINEKGKFGYTALHYAANHSCLNSLAFLLQKGFDINQKDDFGFTPLHHAGYNGLTETVKFLLSNGADCHLTDNYGNTPLHYAARQGRLSQIEKVKPNPEPSAIPILKIETVKLLIENGANSELENNKGETPLDLANRRGHKEIIELLRTQNLSKKRKL